MKRIVAMLFAVALALTLPAAAFASSTGASGQAQPLSNSQALKIALKDAGLEKARVKKVKIESKKNAIEVEFIQKKTKTEYDYTIAKNDGTIVEKEVDYAYVRSASKAKIGKKAALKAVAEFSGFKYSIVKKAKCKYVYKKNEGKYQVKFRYGGYKYEYELLAPDGKVVEVEMDLVRK